MITVFGATGNIGRHLVPDLLSRGERVRAVTRQGDSARRLLDPSGSAGAALEVLEVDLSGSDAERGTLTAVDDASAVFLAMTGTPDQPAQEDVVLRAVAKAGVPRLTKVSVPGPAHEHPVPFARWQAAIEDRIRELGLPATILRPSWFAENFLGSAPTIISDGAVYGSAGDGHVAFVDSRDTAAVAAVTLTSDDHAGREFTVTGPESLTFTQAAQRLSEGLGREVRYVDLTDEQFQDALTGAGLPAALAEAYVAINRNARAGNLAGVTTTVRDLTGTPARDLARWGADHRAAFGA